MRTKIIIRRSGVKYLRLILIVIPVVSIGIDRHDSINRTRIEIQIGWLKWVYEIKLYLITL